MESKLTPVQQKIIAHLKAGMYIFVSRSGKYKCNYDNASSVPSLDHITNAIPEATMGVIRSIGCLKPSKNKNYIGFRQLEYIDPAELLKERENLRAQRDREAAVKQSENASKRAEICAELMARAKSENADLVAIFDEVARMANSGDWIF